MAFPELSYYRETFTRVPLKDETISAKEFEDCDFENYEERFVSRNG
jgi:hypothetical protein